MKEVDVRIRGARVFEDYEAVVELQKRVWGYTELEDMIALPILLLANKLGGHVLVAQEASGPYVGFSFAILARRHSKIIWWSHMTAVLPEYQNREIGLRLKLKQREDAIAAGINEIDWTFDPLRAVNAHFNIRKLGVVVREYEENAYGFSRSPLHQGLPTDRFVAEWHLDSGPVRERIGLEEPALIMRDIESIPRINAPGAEPDLRLEESLLLLEIPVNINELKQANIGLATSWQKTVRMACLHYFAAGYAITDFMRLDRPRPQALYLLEKTLEAE